MLKEKVTLTIGFPAERWNDIKDRKELVDMILKGNIAEQLCEHIRPKVAKDLRWRTNRGDRYGNYVEFRQELFMFTLDEMVEFTEKFSQMDQAKRTEVLIEFIRMKNAYDREFERYKFDECKDCKDD